MNWFGLFGAGKMDKGLKEYKAAPGGVLLDVRTPEEYSAGHIPGSRCLPLQQLAQPGAQEALQALGAGPDTPLFVYCHSGARSRQAALLLGRMGYTQVRDLGGILAYTGKVERT